MIKKMGEEIAKWGNAYLFVGTCVDIQPNLYA